MPDPGLSSRFIFHLILPALWLSLRAEFASTESTRAVPRPESEDTL